MSADLSRPRWTFGAVLALTVVLAYVAGAGWGLLTGRLDVSSYLAGFAPAVVLVISGKRAAPST